MRPRAPHHRARRRRRVPALVERPAGHRPPLRTSCARRVRGVPAARGHLSGGAVRAGLHVHDRGDDWANQRAWPHGGGVDYADGAFFWMAGPMDGDPRRQVVTSATSRRTWSRARRPNDWVVEEPVRSRSMAHGVAVDTVTGPKARPDLLISGGRLQHGSEEQSLDRLREGRHDGRLPADAFKEANFER